MDKLSVELVVLLFRYVLTYLDPVPTIPSAYLIDPNGRALDVITLSNSPDSAAFITHLNNVMKVSISADGSSL